MFQQPSCPKTRAGFRIHDLVPVQFYFKDPREDGKFKPTTEDKLKTLLSMYLLQCAEELADSTPKSNLFVRFRKDQELQNVVDKAKSLLSADKPFFSVDSPNVRVEGAELYGKAARIFVNDWMEVEPGRTITVKDSYLAFQEFCLRHGFVVVDRWMFEAMMAEIIKKEYGLPLRHDVKNELGKQQRGWKGLAIRELGSRAFEPVVEVLAGDSGDPGAQTALVVQ